MTASRVRRRRAAALESTAGVLECVVCAQYTPITPRSAQQGLCVRCDLVVAARDRGMHATARTLDRGA